MRVTLDAEKVRTISTYFASRKSSLLSRASFADVPNFLEKRTSNKLKSRTCKAVRRFAQSRRTSSWCRGFASSIEERVPCRNRWLPPRARFGVLLKLKIPWNTWLFTASLPQPTTHQLVMDIQSPSKSEKTQRKQAILRLTFTRESRLICINK